jgi:pantoate--beta-alanine ligase
VFGQKDFQQAALVRRMIEDLSLGVKLIVHPTVREQDGLAMSSRNVYLSGTDRTLAPILYKSLQAGAAAIKNGTTASRQIQSMMTQVLRRESAATVDYLAVCDPDTLAPLASVSERAVLLGAIRIGHVRLIDNVLVKRPEKRGRR